MLNKKADLAGPGIGTYEEVQKVLPTDYESILTPQETQLAISLHVVMASILTREYAMYFRVIWSVM